MLKHGILGLLNYGDMTGYEIMTVFRDSLSHFWVAQTSQIYRELQKLEENGWINVTHIAQESRPDKNMLSITDAGRAELLRWIKSDTANSAVRSPMLMKTFFRGECSIDENIAFFRDLPGKETPFHNGSENAVTVSSQYEKVIEEPLKALYWKFTIDFGLMYDRMLREWCENCIRKLEEIKHENPAD
nr:PadR family transcriptional regulator [Lachnospiraceae bacterium]